MAPLTPHWPQPSHPEVQEVIINEAEFTSKSLSRLALPPWGLFAKLDFPPCTEAVEPTYATVQYGRDKHLNLNSDLLYINHSCEPSLIFDMARLAVTAGPKGLQPGEELTFFYPSTEWHMAQPFDCLCGKPSCRGRISGASDMTEEQLSGMFLSKHIHELLEESKAAIAAGGGCDGAVVTSNGEKTSGNDVVANTAATTNGKKTHGNGAVAAIGIPAAAKHDGKNGGSDNLLYLSRDALEQIVSELQEATRHAEKAAAAACHALSALQHFGPSAAAYTNGSAMTDDSSSGYGPELDFVNGVANGIPAWAPSGSLRRGPTSRELSGEMGGDTI